VPEWANFEDGNYPATGKLFGVDAQKYVQLIDYSSAQGLPPEFRSPRASRETGKYGLLIRGAPGTQGSKRPHIVGMTVGGTVDRDRLGDKGRALYQCDFFIPTKEAIPSLAVLAMKPVPPGESKPEFGHGPIHFYRFGFHGRTRLYFSFVQDYSYGTATDAEKVPIYRTDKTMFESIPKPGWHRLGIVFEGRTRIRCYVDGREVSFSPFEEATLRKLSVGVMHTSRDSDSIVDNLSIQFTSDARVMPASPYSQGWKIAAGSRDRAGGAVSQLAPVEQAAPIREDLWVDPPVAWATAQQQKRPLFIYFFAPGVVASDQMDRILSTNTTAQQFIQRCTCTRIDVNQLHGGIAARQYGVFKVPTLFIISPDGRQYKRAIFSRGGTWESIASKLAGV
jgi:hypothetical protein